MAVVRLVDERHLARVARSAGGVLRGVAAAGAAGHRRAPGGGAASCSTGAAALVVAGGHVGVLVHVLHLFNVRRPSRAPVVAWSAGAMALTERIVLFHDRAPHGPSHAEVYGDGLGLVPGVGAAAARAAAAARRRPARMAVLASRASPRPAASSSTTATRVDLDPDGGAARRTPGSSAQTAA